MKRFFSDLKKYRRYALYAAASNLKSDVADSYLGWLWWLLDPLLFMLVYTFIHTVVFGKSEDYLAAFIFIGITSFKFFENTIKSSVKLVVRNRSIVKNVYVPKYILLLVKLSTNLIEALIAYSLVFIAMILYRVPFSWTMFEFIPMVFLLVVVTFGFSCLLMHFGVYIQDLANVTTVVVKIIFYLSGVFYSVSKRIKVKWQRTLLLTCNPAAFVIEEIRQCLLHGQHVDWKIYFLWLLIGLLLSVIGIHVIYKNENSYAKVF